MRTNYIYNLDCIEGLKTHVLDESIDLCVTSPPYNVGIEYDVHNDTLRLDDYMQFSKDWLTEVYRVLKPDGRIAVNIPYEVNMKRLGGHNRVNISSEFHQMMKDIGYGFAGIADLVEKAPQKVKYSAWGSWLSASAPYMHNPKECVLIGYKDQWKKLEKGESYWTDSEEDKKGFMEVVSGLWNYFAETRGMTEANFSLDIPVKAIKFMTYKDDIVLDPFMGSGTTAVASVNLDRNYIGFEISENYCKIARSRILKEKIKIETAEKGFDFWE